MSSTIFLLSPAHSGGKRAQFLFNPRAGFELARRLQGGDRVPLGEIFSFLSGLYFRGKLAYASCFAAPGNVLIITSNRGLVLAETPITLDELAEFGGIDIDPADPRYREPLEWAVAEAAARLGPEDRFVLLGSLASTKYVGVLKEILAGKLYFPVDLLGRGDMSRGALLLRCVAAGQELEYAPIEKLPEKARRPAKASPARNRAAPRREQAKPRSISARSSA